MMLKSFKVGTRGSLVLITVICLEVCQLSPAMHLNEAAAPLLFIPYIFLRRNS